jgi:hypothetical protein
LGSRKKQRLFLLFHNQLGAPTIEKKSGKEGKQEVALETNKSSIM